MVRTIKPGQAYKSKRFKLMPREITGADMVIYGAMEMTCEDIVSRRQDHNDR